MKAILVEKELIGYKGYKVHLYKMEPPVVHQGYDGTGKYTIASYDYVIVSTAIVDMVETYVFGADENGNVLNWTEVCGIRGCVSHKVLLAELGYEVDVDVDANYIKLDAESDTIDIKY